MNNITIILPYENAELQTTVWSNMEKEIDFGYDYHRAAKCTIAFAATELKNYLLKTKQDLQIVFSSTRPRDGIFIALKLIDEQSINDRYWLIPETAPSGAKGVTIKGDGRAGVLYGAYQFLKLQGWRWYAPGNMGEIAPPLGKQLILPANEEEFSPVMCEGRGFDFEGELKDSEDLWLWMARNRLNVATYRYNTSALQNKLCMQFKNGGHIFEKILNPDRVLPSGRTIWEQHQEWYGMPASGVRNKESCLSVQFCVSNKALLEFLGQELLQKLKGDWKQAHRIDIWGFDTWGSTCNCVKCKEMGNSSDKALHFLSSLRLCINNAIAENQFDHDVRLIMCAYGGTATIEPPLNPVPQNLADAQDMVVFYPITRCYAHDFSDDCCPDNAYFNKNLQEWTKAMPSLPIVIGEYYNVSKFEDLPLLFTKRMSQDIPYYASIGIKAITYMHLPMLNWAMRTLNQVLYAELSWDEKADCLAIMEEYYQNWYGKYADKMKEVYELLEASWQYCANLRSWAGGSILSQLMMWDGSIPEKPLDLDMHFKDHKELIQKGRQSVNKLQKAFEIISDIRKDIKKSHGKDTFHIIHALNPADLAKQQYSNGIEYRIAEDFRQTIYGMDTMILMTDMVAYYYAMCTNDPDVAEIWKNIEQTAEKLDSYYIPLTFDNPKIGLSCKDALSRTQLRDVINRCRGYRHSVE